MKRFLLFFNLLYVSVSMQAAQMCYHVAVDTLQHSLSVRLSFDVLPNEDDISLYLPAWAPGFYQMMDYDQYVSGVQAFDSSGQVLCCDYQHPHTWVIKTGDSNGRIELKYNVQADQYSVVDSHVTGHTAFIAPNSVFMYRQTTDSVELSFSMPDNWSHVSTSLKETTEGKFIAADFDELYDSPLLLGKHDVRKFSVEGHQYEVAVETTRDLDSSTFMDDIQQMITATTRIMGNSIPYDKYCFLLLGEGGLGGLEHANSQATYTGTSFYFKSRESYFGRRGTGFFALIAHEFFHLYNVKRIRPIELGPFDYQHRVITPMLWMSEGFTVYYESRILLEAGLIDADFFLDRISSSFRESFGTDGYKHMSMRESSLTIWDYFMKWGPDNMDHVISYYDMGPVYGLLFDAEIRDRTNGESTLDDLMRLLYQRFDQSLGRGFTEDEFWAACEEVCGSPLQALQQMVASRGVRDFDRQLALIGLRIDWDSFTISRIPDVSPRVCQLRSHFFNEN